MIATEDSDGRLHRDIVRRSEISQEDIDSGHARLYFDYEGIPMEGLFQELCHQSSNHWLMLQMIINHGQMIVIESEMMIGSVIGSN